MVQPSDKAMAILNAISYITIATVSNDGQPWNTPVAAYRFDGDYVFFWASWQNNQHSRNIRANGKAFIAVYDSTPANNQPTPGVYILAKASELTDEQEVMHAAQVFKADPYNPSDGQQYLGSYPRRIYRAEPQHIWLNDDSEINGNFIDVRVPAEI